MKQSNQNCQRVITSLATEAHGILIWHFNSTIKLWGHGLTEKEKIQNNAVVA